MELTKQQRHEVYKKALQMLYDEVKTGFRCTAVCPNLIDICIQSKFTNGACVSIAHHFPEFYAQKPSDRQSFDVWWDHDEEGNCERKMALLNAIELTKE